MNRTFSEEDRRRISEGIREKYRRVASDPEGHFRYPTGSAGLERLKYPEEQLRILPEEVRASFCGVGNPFSLGPVQPGETVLDVGCGGGVDTLLAAAAVGPEGSAVGVDAVPEILDRARRNIDATALRNVRFEQASAESLPFSDGSFDVVLSNGVLNLAPDKPAALKEIFRVLKPGGRFLLADQVLADGVAGDGAGGIDTWAQ